MSESTPSFTILDLQELIQIIDLLVSRGNIRGEELAPIGIRREKAVAFIEANTPKNVPTAKSSDDTSVDTTSDSTETDNS